MKVIGTLSPIPLGVVFPSVFWYNNTLWYAGGTAYGIPWGSPFPYVMKYEKGEWVNVSKMPLGVSCAYYFVFNNSFWIVGGYNGSYNPVVVISPKPLYTNLIQIYNPNTGKWKILHAPIAMGVGAFEFFNNTLYIVGGMTGYTTPLNTVWEYFPENNTWVSLPSLPYPTFGGSLLVYNRTFMIYVGGWTLINGQYERGLIMVFNGTTWSIYYEHQIVETYLSGYVQIGNNMLFLFGGFTTSNYVSPYIVNVTLVISSNYR